MVKKIVLKGYRIPYSCNRYWKNCKSSFMDISTSKHRKSSNVFDNHVYNCMKDHLSEPLFKRYNFMSLYTKFRLLLIFVQF